MLEDDIFLIVIKLEACQLPDRLSDYQWCDLYEPDGFEQLLKSLNHQLAKTSTPPPNPNTVDSGQYLIEIDKSDNKLLAKIHNSDSTNTRAIPSLKLGNNVQISIKNKQLKLEQILKTLIQAKSKDISQFDDAFQLDLGQYLLKQLFPEFTYSAYINSPRFAHIIWTYHPHRKGKKSLYAF